MRGCRFQKRCVSGSIRASPCRPPPEKSVRASAAALRVARREARLRAYFEESLWPQMRNARRRRDAAEEVAYASSPPGGASEQVRRRLESTLDAVDADIAAVLCRQYVAPRAVLLRENDAQAA